MLLFNRIKLAHFLANSASYTLCMVDNSLAVLHGNCRTSELHAHLAALALVLCNLKCRLVLYILKQCTGTS